MSSVTSAREPKTLYFDHDMRSNICDLDQLPLEKKFADNVKSKASSVACLITDGCLKKTEQGYGLLTENIPNLAEYVEVRSKGIPLGEKEAFYHEPAVGTGTAFLVGNRFALTAAHCVCEYDSSILDLSLIQSLRLVFGFQKSPKETGFDEVFPENSVYRIKKVVTHFFQKDTIDWALLKLDREVTNRIPLKLNFTDYIAKNLKVYMVGHPDGLPQKLSRNGVTQKINSPDYFDAKIDLFSGNSGSPLFNAETHEVVGIAVRGVTDYELVLEYNNRESPRIIPLKELMKIYPEFQRISSLAIIRLYLQAQSKKPEDMFNLAQYYLLNNAKILPSGLGFKYVASSALQAHVKSKVLISEYTKAHLAVLKYLTRYLQAMQQKADKGDVDAQLELGQNCLFGMNGTVRNISLGLLYLNKAADKKNIQAIFKLGCFYLNGDKATRSKTKAKHYFSRGAALGGIESKKKLDTIMIWKDDINDGIEHTLDKIDNHIEQYTDLFKLISKALNC